MTSDIVIPYSNTAGILFAEDFDALPEEQSPEGADDTGSDDHDPAPPPAPVYTEEELHAAVDDAVQKATERTARETRETLKNEYDQAIETENSTRIGTIETLLTSVQTDLASRLDSYADALGKALADAVISAFPQWAEKIETLQAGALLRDILPMFTEDFQVRLRVSPATAALAKTDPVLGRFFQSAWLTAETDASLGPSDFSMTWPDGKIIRRLDDTVSALLSTLNAPAVSSPQ